MTSLGKSFLLISLLVIAGLAFWNTGLPVATAGCCSVQSDVQGIIIDPVNECSLSTSKTSVQAGETLELVIQASHSDGIYQVRYHDGRNWVGTYDCNDQQSCTARWDVSHQQTGTYNYTGGFYTSRGTWLWGWESEWVSCPENIQVTVTESVSPQHNKHTLSGTINGTGIVNVNPPYTDYTADFSRDYDSGTSVTLTAIDEHAIIPEGWKFTGWSGACSGTSYACTVNMTKNRAVTATFAKEDDPSVTYCGISPSVTEIELGDSFDLTVEVEHPDKINYIRYYPDPSDGNWSTKKYCGDAETCSKTWTITPEKTGSLKYYAGYKTLSKEWITCPGHVTMSVKEKTDPSDQYALTGTFAGSGSGQIRVNPPNVLHSNDFTRQYDQDASVVLTPTAHSGSTFAGWSGDCSGTSNCTVIMDQDRSVTATFNEGDEPIETEKKTLSVSKEGEGSGTIVSSPLGVFCGTSCSAEFEKGRSVLLIAVPSTGSTFGSWSGDCSGTKDFCTVKMTEDRSVVATFEKETESVDPEEKTLSVSKSGTGSGAVTSSPSGIDCGTTCSATFDHGTSVTLTAAPDNNSTFTGWSGACSGTDSCSVIMDSDRSVTAEFNETTQPEAKVLLIKSQVDGQDKSGASITYFDGRDNVKATTPHRIEGNTDKITMIQAPSTFNGAKYSHWTNCELPSLSFPYCVWPGRVSDGETREVIVHYTAEEETVDKQTLSLNVTGQGIGTVNIKPPGISTTISISRKYDEGEQVTLTASASSSSTFAGWSGDCSGIGNCIVTMDQDRSVTATFDREIDTDAKTLSVSKSGTGSGTVTSSPGTIDCGTTCSATFDYGTSVTLTATPASGSKFSGWSGSCSGANANCTVSMTADRSVTAAFDKEEVPEKGCVLSASKTEVTAGEDFQLTIECQHPYGIDYVRYYSYQLGKWSDRSNCDHSTDCTFAWTLRQENLGEYKYAAGFRALPEGGIIPLGHSDTGEWVYCANKVTIVVKEDTPPPTEEDKTLSVFKSGTGSGTVTSSPSGIDCGATCSATFDHGISATLTATPIAGSEFTGWSGDCSGAGSCTVIMDQDRSVTATFNEKADPGEYILNVISKLDGQDEEGVAISRVSGNVEAGTTNYSIISQETISGVLTAPEVFGENSFSHWSGCQASLGRNCTALAGEATIGGLPVKTESEVTIIAHYVTESVIEAGCTVSIEPEVVDKNETFRLTLEAQHPDGITYTTYHERGTKDGWLGRSYCHDQQQCTIVWPLTQSSAGTYEYAVGFHTPTGKWFECPKFARVTVKGNFNVTVQSSIDGVLQEGVDISRISGKWFTSGTTEYLISDWKPFTTTLRAPGTHQGNEFSHWEDCTLRVGRLCTATVGLWPYQSDKTITAHYTPFEPSCSLSAPSEVEKDRSFRIRMRIQHPEGIDYARYQEVGGAWSGAFDCNDDYECTADWHISRDQLGTYEFQGEFYSINGEKFSCDRTVQVTVKEKDPVVPGPGPQPTECQEGETRCVVIVGGTDHYIEECRNGEWVATDQPCFAPDPECEEGAVSCIDETVWLCSNGQWSKTDDPCYLNGDTPPECQEPAVTCINDEVYICLNEQWVSTGDTCYLD